MALPAVKFALLALLLFFILGAILSHTNVKLLVIMVTIAVGIQERPSAAPQTGPWKSDWKLVGNPSFTETVSAIATTIFSFSGVPGFFPIVAEMRNPAFYNRALFTCQAFVTSMYIAVGCVVYYYCGSYVASPALGSAGKLIKKVAYGIALPGLLVSGVIVYHVSFVPSWADACEKYHMPETC